MNLLNYTLRYLAFALFGIISVWAVLFYINMLDEVYDSLDDGLDNYKLLILEKVNEDPATLSRTDFGEANYEIREISSIQAFQEKDSYRDTLMYMMNEKDLEPVRMLTTDFKYKDRFYELKIISSMVEEDDLIEDLFFALIWLYVALIVSILVVNNFLLKKVWKPFYHLLEQLKHFQLGKGEPVKTADTDVKEFRELNSAVTSLVLHTLETYNSQKQFIENASHELQTPVAISINKLEMLAEKNDLGEAGLEAVGQVIQTLERLTRLNKSLLLLSKIENRQFPETENVSVNDLAAQLTNEFADFAEYKDITIKLYENSRLSVSMQKDLAAILLSNLLKNAIVHNYSHGSVNIYIEKDHFSISNSGNPEALDKDKIFRRFHKSNSGKNNTGLGLAIVKAIADLYGFGIEYVFDNMHTIKIHVEG
ncbi:sensor histidine kinase [Dyadobacter sediminis]|uniref:histidine kinase n=1 Tax=Dyadobacter sediminis TaxID=1493691 RepID=A0A5R9K962_9BACT|nr:HAMP domain-containing sensor histidine kinase [Dyadobacter sediminis]TLU90565.1 HAMP domain-containing histidine kinase [Dyadobacter sediminis]GGC08830.1 two-component sensor histidine kinase [Dyadobacter sediminis]